MITATSKQTYQSKNKKLSVYETCVQIESEDTAEVLAELESILKAVISSELLNAETAVRIAQIMEDEAETLAKTVRQMMGGDDNVPDPDT